MKKRIEIVISIDEASIDDDNITIEERIMKPSPIIYGRLLNQSLS